MDRRDDSLSEVPPLLVFVVILAGGVLLTQLARHYVGLGPQLGNILFVSLPITAALVASRHATRR